jgi:hypothetical protein
VDQLGANAHGEVLESGRVPDCYLGPLLDPPRDQQAGRVLVVAPASLLHPAVPQPGGHPGVRAGDRPPRPAATGAGVYGRPGRGAVIPSIRLLAAPTRIGGRGRCTGRGKPSRPVTE